LEFLYLLASRPSLNISIKHESMEVWRRSTSTLIIVLVFAAGVIYQAKAYTSVYCINPASRCYGKTVECPYECPTSYSEDPKAKICYIDCDSPICTAHCKRKIDIILLLIYSFLFFSVCPHKLVGIARKCLSMLLDMLCIIKMSISK
jgi:hypothetical protein